MVKGTPKIPFYQPAKRKILWVCFQRIFWRIGGTTAIAAGIFSAGFSWAGFIAGAICRARVTNMGLARICLCPTCLPGVAFTRREKQ